MQPTRKDIDRAAYKLILQRLQAEHARLNQLCSGQRPAAAAAKQKAVNSYRRRYRRQLAALTQAGLKYTVTAYDTGVEFTYDVQCDIETPQHLFGVTLTPRQRTIAEQEERDYQVNIQQLNNIRSQLDNPNLRRTVSEAISDIVVSGSQEMALAVPDISAQVMARLNF